MLDSRKAGAGLVAAALAAFLASGAALAAFLASGAALAAGGSLAGRQPFVNGGITSDEADAMRQEATHYPLEITLARRGERPGLNDFIAGAQLRVIDSSGRLVVDRADAGPIFLADLPPGSYTIEATYSGQTKTDRVQLSNNGRAQVTLLWE